MIRIAICGYGNIGRGVELAIRKNDDMQCAGIFTRRPPETLKALTGVPVYSIDALPDRKGAIDVLVLCSGSSTDLPEQTPQMAALFNVVDSFDTHARIPEHFALVNAAAKAAGTTALISGGWDPGLFSLMRLYGQAVLPEGNSYTFWGRGVSQGHSDAIRRIPGVEDARQYTVPVAEAVAAVRAGEQPVLTTRQKHTRECYVVAKEGADKNAIEKAIITMPNYFADYDTTVTFISKAEMQQNHSALPHGGSVLRSGTTGMENEHKHTMEFSLKLDSNPEFTAGVLVALARGIYRMNQRGETGCKTIFEMPPADLSPLSIEELRATLL